MTYKMHFVSDTHFFHRGIIDHCDRPYDNVDDMNEDMITIWNDNIGVNDDVYHIGDVAWHLRGEDVSKMYKILSQLNGKIHLVPGNHDDKVVREVLINLGWNILPTYNSLKFMKQKMILMHYPIASWDGLHHGNWHLHGHSHGSYFADGKILDVGWDVHHRPIDFDEVKDYMDKQSIGYVDHHRER